MNDEIIEIANFVENANKQWQQQYKNTINALEENKKSRIAFEQKKNARIQQVKLDDIEKQLTELDNIERIFIAQNQSTQNISKIKKTIENFKNILSKNTQRENDDASQEISRIIDVEIEKYKKIEYEWIKEQKNKLDQMMNDISSRFKAYDQSILTNKIENININELDFEGFYPICEELKISDKIYTYELFGKKKTLQIPQIIKFLLKNNITLSFQPTFDIKPKIQELIIRILLSSEAGNIKLLFIDSRSNGENFKEFLSLNSDLYSGNIFSNEVVIESKLAEMEKHMTFISQNKLIDYENIIDYNRTNPKDAFSLYFIFFDNYPYGISTASAKTIEKLIRIGTKAGIHSIFFTYEDDFNNDSYNLLQHTYHYSIDKDDAVIPISLINKLRKRTNELFDLRYKPDKNLYFTEYVFQQNEMWKTNAIDLLDIPIGMKLTKPVSLVYDNILKTHAHIVGKTGSGKSTLLHTIIMSACYKYSPKELELWLLDFKNGAEFQIYAREQLPHAKVITLKNEKEVALHILNLVEKEIDRRAELFKKASVNDFTKYRKQSQNNELPRILVVIDEYQLLYNEDAIKFSASKSITMLLEKGRSYGVSILFASQTVHIPNDSLGNISTRIALRTDLGRQLLESGSSKTLSLTLGQGILNTANGNIENDELFRWFYLRDNEPDNELKALLLKVIDAAKHNQYFSKTQIFDGEAKADLRRVKLLKYPNAELLNELIFVPGEKVLIDDVDFECKFIKQPNNNLLVVSGVTQDPSIRSLYGTFITMLPQLKINNAKIYMMNLIKKNSLIHHEAIESISSFLKDNEFDINYIDDDLEITGMLNSIQDLIENNKDSEKPVIGCLVIFNAENSDALKYDKNLGDYSEDCQKLIEILTKGSENGFFSLLQYNSCEGFYNTFNEGDWNYFNHRIALQMTYEDSRSFVENPNQASGLYNQEIGDAAINRSCYYNSQLQYYGKLKPFEFQNGDVLKEIINN